MSASEIRSSGLCSEVEERLSEVLDGTAPATLFDHIAECDACRDSRHEASLAAEMVASAAADFRPAGDFAEQLLARVTAARPGAPVAPSSSEPATGRGAPSSASRAPFASPWCVVAATGPDAGIVACAGAGGASASSDDDGIVA